MADRGQSMKQLISVMRSGCFL